MFKLTWKKAMFISCIILLIGGISIYKYRNQCIIRAVEYGLSGEIDPTKDMHIEDYKSVQEYSAACRDVEAYYEEHMFNVIAKNFWTTPEHVKEMYMEYIEDK